MPLAPHKIRSQIYLDPLQHRELQALSQHQRTSASAIIRAAIQQYLEALFSYTHSKALKEKSALLRMKGIGRSKRHGGSIHHDQHLYGGKNPL